MDYGFIQFSLFDAIDIFLVALLLYAAYTLARGTNAVKIFFGFGIIYVFYIVINAIELKLLSSILSKFINVGVIAIMIVFQQEIRKFLLYIGSNEFLKNNGWRNLIKFGFKSSSNQGNQLDIEAIVDACFKMSKTKTGALIVIARKTDLKLYINTGDQLDSSISSRMIENIFFKNSPMHDGAMIIADNRIVATRCVLPVTEKENFPAHYGMRHRAAVGITETTDALAISVSEQTGNVSLTMAGEINAELSPEKLRYLLEKNITSVE
ncbi:MAG: TIGR00159 family protein [Bacteroidetes bacterium]|nr:TIGR00159 family protein [Bacteroidota bacterium]MCA6441828.1 TIGR00159 family protein [Bacteroidota bacterium]